MTQVLTSNDVTAGALLADKYRMVRVLGRGGMGIVVEAIHVRLDERVAIKFLALEQMERPEVRARFEREARATVRLRSEHVARVRDVGELPTGQPYIVMEYLDGTDLTRHCEDEPLDPGEIIDLGLQACEALAEAHALGIIHRDLKPANLFLLRDLDGRRMVKILDFGIATAPIEDIELTGTGTVMGTPAYMCPEQMRSSRAAEPHWDLWALAAVLYHLLERTPPFQGDSFAELAVAVLTGEPREMDRTPEPLRPILMRCFAKDPADRFADASQLAAALTPFAATPAQAIRSRARITAFSRGTSPTLIPSRPSTIDVPAPPIDTRSLAPTTVPPSPPSEALHTASDLDASGASPPTATPSRYDTRQALPRRRMIVVALALVGVVVVVVSLARDRGGQLAPSVSTPIDAHDRIDPSASRPPVDSLSDSQLATEPDGAVDAAPIETRATPGESGGPPDKGRPRGRPSATKTIPGDAADVPKAALDAGVGLSEEELMKGRN